MHFRGVFLLYSIPKDTGRQWQIIFSRNTLPKKTQDQKAPGKKQTMNILRKYTNNPPKYRVVNGKYVVDMDRLNNKKQLIVTYASSTSRVAGIQIMTKLSDNAVDVIRDILDDRFVHKRFMELPIEERHAIDKFKNRLQIVGAGLDTSLNNDELEEEYRVATGLFFAGNNSREVVNKIKQLVLLNVKMGYMSYADGLAMIMAVTG